MKPRVRKAGGFWWVCRPDRPNGTMGPYVNWHQAMFIALHPSLWF